MRRAMSDEFPYVSPPKDPPPKVFISYATADKQIAGRIKLALSAIGVDAFLAHEDIHVSEEWKHRILQELREMDVFIPVLSAAFRESSWAPQETGVAAARDGVVMIPLCVDSTIPFGFIDHIQGKRLPEDGTVPDDFVVMPLSRRFPRAVIPQLIDDLKDARSFRGAEALMRPLVPFFAIFANEEANAFAIASINNGQIWDAGDCASEYLPAFLTQCASQLDSEVREALEYQVTNRKWYRRDKTA